MLGPFATASRRTPPVLILHCHSPGVATVDTTHYQDEPKPAIAIAQAACDSSDRHLVNGNVKSMSTTTTTTTTRDSGDRYGPIEWAQLRYGMLWYGILTGDVRTQLVVGLISVAFFQVGLLSTLLVASLHLFHLFVPTSRVAVSRPVRVDSVRRLRLGVRNLGLGVRRLGV